MDLESCESEMGECEREAYSSDIWHTQGKELKSYIKKVERVLGGKLGRILVYYGKTVEFSVNNVGRNTKYGYKHAPPVVLKIGMGEDKGVAPELIAPEDFFTKSDKEELKQDPGIRVIIDKKEYFQNSLERFLHDSLYKDSFEFWLWLQRCTKN